MLLRFDRLRIEVLGRVGFISFGDELILKLRNDGFDGPAGGFTEGADGATIDLVGDGLEGVDVFRGGFAFDDAVGELAHPCRSFTAWCALAARLVSVKVIDIVEDPGNFS